MKVTNIEVFPIAQDVSGPAYAFSQAWVSRRSNTLVVVETDEGISGVGEALGPPVAVAATVKTVCAPLVIGQDPFQSSVIWDSLHKPWRHHSQKGIFTEALSALREELRSFRTTETEWLSRLSRQLDTLSAA